MSRLLDFLSFYVVCLHLHVLLAGAFVAFLGVLFPGLLVPMGCPMKEDGSVVTRVLRDGLFCEGRWLRCHVVILYFVMGFAVKEDGSVVTWSACAS